MAGTTILQEWLIPVLFGGISYFLVYNPQYFGAAAVGSGALFFSPIGGFLLAPHATKAIYWTTNSTAETATEVLIKVINDLAGDVKNIEQMSSFVSNTVEGAIDTSLNKLNYTTEAATDWTKDLLRKVVNELESLENLTTKFGGFIVSTAKTAMDGDLWALMTGELGQMLTSGEATKPFEQTMSAMSLDVMSKDTLKTNLVNASKNAIADQITEPTFINTLVASITTAVGAFRDILSTGASARAVDPIKTGW